MSACGLFDLDAALSLSLMANYTDFVVVLLQFKLL